MRGFIAGAAVVVAIVVLVAAGMNDTAGLPTVNDLPLANALNARFQVAYGKPLAFTLPTQAGFVLTYLKTQTPSGDNWRVSVNGLPAREGNGRDLGLGGWWVGGSCVPRSNPPLIVPPGATLKIEILAQVTVPQSCEIGGYFISRADLGMP